MLPYGIAAAVPSLNWAKKEDALAALDQVTELMPENNEAWYHKGLLLREVRRYEEALSAFGTVIERDPISAELRQ